MKRPTPRHIITELPNSEDKEKTRKVPKIRTIGNWKMIKKMKQKSPGKGQKNQLTQKQQLKEKSSRQPPLRSRSTEAGMRGQDTRLAADTRADIRLLNCIQCLCDLDEKLKWDLKSIAFPHYLMKKVTYLNNN